MNTLDVKNLGGNMEDKTENEEPRVYIRKRNTKHNLPDVPPKNENPPHPGYEPIFTQTQARILSILADGEPHYKKELMTCIEDDLAGVGALREQIKKICKKIEPYGSTIACVASGRVNVYQRFKFYNK